MVNTLEKSQENKLQDLSQEHIALMNIYLEEWKHRDVILRQQVFRFFYATLIIIFFPNFSERINIELPNIPQFIFPII